MNQRHAEQQLKQRLLNCRKNPMPISPNAKTMIKKALKERTISKKSTLPCLLDDISPTQSRFELGNYNDKSITKRSVSENQG
ncbi:hypothetical protein ACH0R5_000644 [Vibrio vulnificus]